MDHRGILAAGAVAPKVLVAAADDLLGTHRRRPSPLGCVGVRGPRRVLVVHPLVPARAKDQVEGPPASAVATALFWIGMEVVFSIIFSNTVISDNNKYGPIGVVFALMSWLIAIGVVVILGAVAGIVWRDRGSHSPPGSER